MSRGVCFRAGPSGEGRGRVRKRRAGRKSSREGRCVIGPDPHHLTISPKCDAHGLKRPGNRAKRGYCSLDGRRGVAGGKIRVVRNGTLGGPRFRPIRDYQLAALRSKAIVTVVGTYWRKGIAELIAAFEGVASRFREAPLYLVGDRPGRGKTKWQKLAVQNLEVYTVNHVAEETEVVCRELL